MHTGDAGFIGDDGELYITGRYKESIVIHGVNYYPTDLETVSVKSNKSFNYAACAFSATFEDEDSIIIIQEIKGKTLSLDTLKDAAKDVRNNIFKSYQLQPHKIILVEENSIPRTDSGKIQRRTAKELFIKDALCGVLYEEQMKDADLSQIEVETVEDIKNIIVDLLADSLGIATAEVDLDMTFMKMGMNSQMNVNIVAQLNTVPGVKLSVVDVFNQNTVDKLATHIFDTCFSESIKTDDLDALNEDELAMLLEQELG